MTNTEDLPLADAAPHDHECGYWQYYEYAAPTWECDCWKSDYAAAKEAGK